MTTESKLLDNQAVEEIEARVKDVTLGLGCLHLGPFIRGDIPALCATVKHLRGENERLKSVKSERMIVREDAERFIRQHLHSAQWEGETLVITFENEALIAALIGDVEL